MKRGAQAYSIGELIFAVVIVSAAALVLAFSILEYQRSEHASKIVFAVVSMESALVNELTDSKNYQDENAKIALRTNRSLPKLSFTLNIKFNEDSSVIVIHPNETLALDRSFKQCSGYPLSGCGYKLKLNLQEHPPAFSYEVSSAFPEAAFSVERGDRSEVIIPKSFYRDPYRVACDPRREIGFSGLVSSDRYDCVSKPQLWCARGSLPKSLNVNSKTHSLEFDCGRASKVARCPANYSLNRVDTRSLDEENGEKTATCVRTTASAASPAKQPASALRLAGRACPVGYKSDSSCQLVNVKFRVGHCGAGIAQPVAGRLRFIQNKQQGSVDCGVDLQNQSCGASWEGLAQLKIRCLLDQPEFVDALK